MAKGETVGGRIVAIDVDEVGDEHRRRVDEYVIQFGPERGNTRTTIRQRVEPDSFVRLGMAVAVKVRGDDAVIDWAQTMAAVGLSGGSMFDHWKMVKDPGFTGIRDATLGLDRNQRKGVPATVTINSAALRSAAFGLAHHIVVDSVVQISGQPAYALELKKVEVPHYATHLLRAGVTLPGWVRDGRPDKVAIDWPAAAMADPGVGVPPSDLLEQLNSGGGVTAMSAGGWLGAQGDDDEGDANAAEFASMMSGAPAFVQRFTPTGVGEPEPINGVSFEQYVAIEVAIKRQGLKPKDWDAFAQTMGVAPGTWAKTSQQWGRQMAFNPALAQRFAAALQ